MDEISKRKKILIVEDNISNYKLIEAILKLKELDFDWVVTGQSAVDMFKKNKYDMILMDIQIPDLDGYEVTQKIREIDREIPIIVISALAMNEHKLNSLKSGCNDFIPKPYTRSLILSILEKYL